MFQKHVKFSIINKNKMSSKIKTSTKIIFTAVLVSVLIIVAHQYVHFTNLLLEAWLDFYAGLIIFLSIIVYSFTRVRRSYALLSLLFWVPFLLVYTLMGLLVVSVSGANQELQRIHLNGSDLVVYRTNCGATCSYGLLIRNEKTFFFGQLQNIDIVESYDKAYDIAFEKVDDDRIRVSKVEFYKDRGLSDEVPKVGDVWTVSKQDN